MKRTPTALLRLASIAFPYVRIVRFFVLCCCVAIAGDVQGQAYTYSGPGAVPDNSCSNGYTDSGESFPLTVAGVGLINGSTIRIDSVRINVAMSWDSDLNIWLEGPSGAILELSTGNGTSGDNYTNTVFHDGASTFVTAGVAPFTGSFRPEGRNNVLSGVPSNTPVAGTYTLANTFTGTNANGVWNLRICDGASGDSASVQNWTIYFSGCSFSQNNDAGISAFNSPVAPFSSGVNPIVATLCNFGTQALTSAQIDWTLNGVQQAPFLWTGNLPANATDNVTLGNVNFLPGTTYAIKAWPSLPNGLPDACSINDTLQVNNLAAALSGTYTIGGSNPDFPTFSQAALVLNNGGVLGPVAFNVRNGTYPEKIALRTIPGASVDTPITFQSETGDSSAVVLQADPATGTDGLYVLKLDGTDYVRFQKLTIKALGSSSSKVLALLNNANQNKFTGCVFEGFPYLATTNVDNYNNVFISDCEQDTFIGNRLIGGYRGITIQAAFRPGLWVSGNQFENQSREGIYVSGADGIQILNNRFSSNSVVTGYFGIEVTDAKNAFRIERNWISSNFTQVGIFLTNNDGDIENPYVVANNFLNIAGNNVTQGFSSGIETQNDAFGYIVYNTVRFMNTTTNSRAFGYFNGTAIHVRDNLFAYYGNGRAAVFNPSTGLYELDNNDYYSTSSTFYIFGNGQEYTSLPAWQNATVYDEMSLATDPLFTHPDSFRIVNNALNGAALPIPEVPTDILGQTRNLSTPDIGCAEFDAVGLDAGVLMVIAPERPFASGVYPVQAIVRNHGTQPLTSLQVNWNVNGVPQTPAQWTGTLLSGEADTIGIGSYNFGINNNFDFIVWTSAPNGQADAVPANDTSKLNDVYAALGGTYTVGGTAPQFLNLTQANTQLAGGGVVGPVVFNVRNGSYSGQLNINPVTGASAANPITFQSEAGDSSQVVVTFASTSSTANYTVRLNGADYIRFRKMTLRATGTSFGRVVELLGGASNNILENNRLESVVTTSTAQTFTLVYSAADKDDNNIIRNNYFFQGDDGVFMGGTTTLFEDGNVVQNNTFVNQYRRAINLFYQNASVIEGNTISTNTGYTAYNGIVAYFCNGNQRVTKNKLNLGNALVGIALDNCTGTSLNRGLTANNFVQIAGTLQADGILFTSSFYQNGYFNSVHINGSNVNSRPFSLFAGSNLRLFNNIGYNSTNGGVIWRSTTTNLEASNNNDFFTTGPNLVYTQSTNSFYANLTAWQAGTGFDANSISVNPQFISATDLHTNNILLEGKGTPFPEVITDFDGQMRSLTTPDIGADEFLSTPLDAAVLRFVQLTAPVPAGPAAIKVLLKNNGANTLTSLQFNLQLNNAAPVPIAWSGNLLSADSVIVDLGTVNLPAGRSSILTAWSSLPNGLPDQNPVNDTARFETDGLVAYYSFCGCSPNDNSGMTNDGVLVGNPACAAGKSGQGILLNPNAGGNNGCGLAGGQYVQLSPLDAIWQDGFTVSAWVRFDNPSSYERIIDIGNGNGDAGGMPVWFGRESTTNNLMMDSWISSDGTVNRSTGRLSAPNTIINGVFQHYCATIGPGNTMRIYVNGELKAEKTGHPILNVPRYANFIGHSSWCSSDPDTRALIDELRLYNRALSPAEISTLYLQSPSFADYNKTVCAGTPVQLEARGALAYQWTPNQFLNNANIANPISTPQNGITYNCQLTLADGCTYTDSLHIDVSAASALNGTYTIGGSSPNYANFTAAVTALSTLGVCGPVVFKVRNGTYNEQLTIQAVAGASAFNTITFESESGDSSLVVLTFTSTVSTTPWTLRLFGADYLTFRKMTIEANGTTYAQAVQLTETAQNNRFLNCVLRSTPTTSTASNRALIYCVTGENKNNTFRKNRFVNGSLGLWFEGNTNNNAYIDGIAVDSNLFVDQYEGAAYLSYIRRAKIRANTINSAATGASYTGVQILNSLDSTEISANRIFNVSANSYGIYFDFLNGTALAPALIANNFIEINGSVTRAGIYGSGGSYVNAFYNTVRVSNTSVDSRALEMNSITSMVVRNNIFSNTGSGYAIYKSGGTLVSNNNDLFSKGNRTGYWSGTITATLAAWQTASAGLDLNSVAIDPQFASTGAYRPRVIGLNAAATPAPPVTLDIDGEARNGATPDIGADEFTPDNLDAAVLSFVGLTTPVPAGQTSIRVLLKNNGLTTLTSAEIRLKINNNAPVLTNWSGTLASDDTVEVNLGNLNLLAGQNYDLYAWSTLPNGAADQYPSNDTAKVLNLLPALNGVYTIGGTAPDFPNFTAATNALTQAGVAGPVTFNARNGTYSEAITIGPIPGVDSSRQVVFQSESGDSTLVILTFTSTVSTAPWTLRLNGADYCTFRKMTFEANGASYAQAVQLVGDAQYNRFLNNVFRSTAATTTSNNRALVYFSSTGENKNATFRNNRFTNGSVGLWFEGNTNGGAYVADLVVDSNQCVNQYYAGIYCTYVRRAKLRWNTVTSSSAYTSYYGIYLLNSLDSTEISANRIFNVPADANGISLQSITGSVSTPVLVANNFVETTGAASIRQCLAVSSGSYVNLYHNTLRMLSTNTGSQALYLTAANNSSVRNNLVVNTGGGYAVYHINGSTALSLNYNNYYATGANLGYWVGTTVPSLAAWRSASGNQDLNSKSVDPVFAGSGQYRPRAIELNNAGTPLSTVPRDLEGEARSASAPDIGADEFAPDAVDAAVLAFTGLTAPVPVGPTPVRVVLKNNGLNPLTSLQLSLKVNSDAPIPATWSGNLASGDTVSYQIASVNLVGGQTYNLTAWSALPNGIADPYPANDTAKVLNLLPALNGVYTIGGASPNFATFTAAATALMQAGVSGAVTFNVRNGTYAEQITLGQIPGVDSLKPVVFQSEAGDSSLVVLRFNAVSTANFTVRLNGTDWITFRKMTVEGQNATYGHVFSIEEGANNVTLNNNSLIGNSATSTSTNRVLVYATGTTTNNNLRIFNNRMLNGSHAVYYIGPTANGIYTTGTFISSNRMEGQYNRGVYLQYNKDAIVEKNTILPGAYFGAFGGIEIYEAYNSPRIIGNKIYGTSDGYGIYASNLTGTVNNPALIANNFIQLGSGSSSAIGISTSGTQLRIVHNSIRVNSTNTTSKALALTGINPSVAVNNILANYGAGPALFVNTGQNSTHTIDYNDLYAVGQTIAQTGFASYTTLTDWKNANLGFDEHSISVNPLFYANNDYRVAQSDLNNAGTPNAFVTTDIEGEARNAQNPDIGADEFTPVSADAGIALLVTPAPPFPAGSQSIQAVLKNHGTAALTSASIEWTVNGTPQLSQLWTGNLPPGATETIVLGSVNFAVGQGISLKAWTSNPNTVPDVVPANDTTAVSNLYPGLAGVYTIGGAAPDFSTFTQAVSALQNGGVVGAVTLNARSGTYAEQIALNPILGASAANTVTFQSESGDSTAVVLQFNANSTNNFTVRLNGADWIRFRKMTLQALNTTYGTILDFTGGADNNTVENNRLLGVATTSTSTLRALVNSSGTRDIGNVFRSNYILNGSYGLYFVGISGSGNLETGTVVENNRFENQYSYALHLIYQNAPLVSGNTISSTSTNTAYTGMWINVCDNGQRVIGNKLTLSNALRGINIDNSTGTAATPGLVANNFVQIGGTLVAEGIYTSVASYQNFYFNSVHINSSNATSRAFALNSGSNLRLFNNIGYNSTGGYVLQRSVATNISASNYNDFFTTGPNLVFNSNNTTFYTTLAAWRTATGFDANSLSTTPLFVSATDLHTTNVLLDKKALPFAEVPTDIDGQFRNTTTPDIGADEFLTAPHEAGVLSVDYPKKVFGAGTQPVRVTIVNNGLDTLHSVQIAWELNGVAQPTYTWAGTLLSGGILDSVTIGTGIFAVNTPYSIRAWTRLPNGLPDGDMSNDTAVVNNLYAALGGTYTLGGTNPDFPTFASAITAMALGGVVDSVFFNVRNGTYTEQITLKEVPGAGAGTHITFQSESGDSTAVKLTFNSTSTNNYTVRLDSADWFRFRRMTLEATNATYGRVVYLLSGAEHNRFENIVFQGVTSGASTTDLVFSDASADNYTAFTNNRFEGGYTGVYMNGSTVNETDLVIRDNIFNNQSYRPIFLTYESAPIIQGNKITQITSNTGTYGIYLNLCNNGFNITKNQIRLRRLYGIFLDNCDTPVGVEGLVANNFISIGEGLGNGVYGIYLSGSDRARIYFNSVQANSSSTSAYALYNASNNGPDIKNNIFACPLGAIPILSNSATNVSSNYNNLYTTGSQIGSWESTAAAALSDWQALSGQDANSRSINPQFVSNTDLHLEEADLNGVGTPTAGVADDIDGEPRNAVTPDIGADEFAPMTLHDVGVEALIEPNKSAPFAAGLREVKAVLKNNGIDTIMTMTVQWRVNNLPKTPYNWSGALLPGQRDTVVVGTHNFAVGVDHDLIAFAQNPNGFPDNNPANDTARVNDLYAALNGTYTLGGVVPNFATFDAAVNALNRGGVLGPVTFNVRNGTYTQTSTLTFTNIKGASTGNRIVFQAESGDSTLVTLTRTGSSGSVVQLDNADYITFKKMTCRIPNAATFFYLENGSSDVYFLNNRFVDPQGTSSSYIYGINGTNSIENNIQIRNNRFEGAGYAIRLSGGNVSVLEAGAVIENNVFDGTRNNAIILEYQNAPKVIENTFLGANRPIQCSYCDNALVISGNRISVDAAANVIYAVEVYLSDASNGNRGTIANNFVQVGGNQVANGIRLYYCTYQNVYYNSVHANNTNSTSQAFHCEGGNDVRAQNNIFANTGGGYATYVTGGNPLAVSNFNDLYSSGANLAYWNGTNAANLTALRTLSGREQNSVSANPLFYSATDLHVLQVALDSAASFAPEVITDIDGQPRNSSYPDIGADEFDYRTKDVGVSQLLTPIEQCELSANAAVKVVIQNYGGLPQTGFNVAYRLNNNPPVVENIGARVIQPGDTIQYTFAQPANVSAYTPHLFTLYTTLSGDLNPASDTLLATVTNYQTPLAVSNMLPANGSLNVDPPVTFSWLPAAGATRYDIYVWKADQAQPATPTGQDLTQISYFYNPSGLVYGAAYNWKVVSKNNYCSTSSPVRQFTLRELPDLKASNVMAPAQPFSGTMISVSWTTTNNGSGATGMHQWYDYVYLSTDAVYQAGTDIYLGGASNLTALNPAQGYSQMANVTLPQGIQGNYYVIVVADNGAAIGESNENNNVSAAFPIVVNLTPPPDLKVTSIVAPTSVFSGQTINISFTVKNQGTGNVPPGNTFQDRVYLSPTPTLNLSTAINLGTYNATPISAGVSQTRMLSATLPQAIFGDYYIHVYTDRNNEVFEFAFEDNNIAVSDTLTIFLTPPPDLVVSQVSGPALVSNNQSVSLQWTVENQGASTANGGWTDRVYLSKAAMYKPDSVIQVGSFGNPGNLAAGASALRTGSVVIPGNLSGAYYFYVYADVSNSIFEFTNENNNTARSSGTTTVLNADLRVTAVSVPATANSGTSIPVDWTVKNEGLGSVLNVNRTDQLYLSQNPVLDIPTSTLLGSVSYGGSLLSGQSVGKQTSVTLPNGISGVYFIHVLTDAGNTVYENQSEGNNSLADTVTVQLSPWPDLEPTLVDILPDTLLAGQTLPFGYTVQNTGTAALSSGGWQDRVLISASPVYNAGNATQLAKVDLLQPLAVNGTYNRTTQLSIPLASPGMYYLYVLADAGNSIYEYTDEDNNVLRSTPFYIKTPDPVDFDVMEDELSALPDTVNSGQQVNLSWCIQNLGSSTAVFNFQLWYDGVYLSTDSIWDEYDDIFVKDFTKNGPVDSLKEYNNIQNFTIPNGLSGNFYAFLVADHNERTNDEERDNNIGRVRPAAFPTGPIKPIHIKLTPSPDLEAATFLAPANGTSGQPVQVIWTVKNNGPGTTSGTWTDKVYLSGNFTVDGSDAIIGTKSQSRVLAPGQQYNDTLDVYLPVSAAGNYILIFKTDANNTLYEFNAEGNNTFFSYITVIQPAPSDLIVNSMSFAPMAMVGEPFTVTWSIQNQGSNPASGIMRELIYFSADSLFDSSDIPLSAAIQRSINLPPNASASKSFTANTPGLPLGNYFLIAATDVLDNILESDEGNNQRISTSKVMVTVQELPIGVLTPDTLVNNTPLYYRIEVPANLDNETLLLTLDGLTTGGVNELYLSHGKVPTRSSHDFAFGNPNLPDQSILVPELDSGTYYLLAYGATDFPAALGKQNITLKAEIINFQILDIMAAQGGNTGNVTVRVDGAKFAPNMTLKLTDPGLGTRIATKITYVNSTRVFATFNLAGAAQGVYDVVALKQAETATLPDGFTVVAGDAGTTSSGDGSNGFFCNIVNIGTDQNLSENVQHPAAVRVNRLVPITIQYGNAGNVDIPMPSRFLISLRGAPLAFLPDDLDQNKQDLYLEFQEIGGPPGVLRPGSFSSITVYSFSSHPLRFVLTE